MQLAPIVPGGRANRNDFPLGKSYTSAKTAFLHAPHPARLGAMKRYPSRPPPRPSGALGRPRRRIPAFHPVPVGQRHDGWTPARQVCFIGMLYETRSVVAAAKAVGMGRESAYRLRKRPGAAGFAAAWDAAMGVPVRPVRLDQAKSTGLPAHYRMRAGLMQVLVRAGCFAGVSKKPDNSALLQHVAQLDRHWAAEAMADWPE